MREFFTKHEDRWLRAVADDYAWWKAQKGDVQHFMTCTVKAWLNAFPYRHTRLRNHVPHTYEEDKLTMYGEEYWCMTEVS
jgi:hypothetical protein